MVLPACRRCGKTDPRKMFGLMTHWFGPFVDLRPDHGYFHLCPACYEEHIRPHLEAVQGRLAELHPLARHLEQEDGSQDGAAPDPSTSSPADRARAADEAARRSVQRKRAEGGGG